MRSLHATKMLGVDISDSYGALKLQATPALHGLHQCNLKNSVLICVSLIPMPKRRLRYSLLELCDRRKVRGERKRTKTHPNALLQDIILGLPIPDGPRECEFGISKMDKEREERRIERRHACAESYSCRRCINLRTRPSCCRHRLRSQDSGEQVRPPQPHHLRCHLRCHSRLVSPKCLGPFA
jgi:hypothetical protein